MRVAALTGAGISAESGVPTFRGASGLWRDHRPEDLATPEAFSRDPSLVWEFYAWRRTLVAGAKPNRAHLILAQIEAEGHDLIIITQNVDGLHQKAGSRRVIELHGSLWQLRCTLCNTRWDSIDTPLPELPPTCSECGGLARPNVVWFGESLDQRVLQQAINIIQEVDTLLVIGTSALVQPAASFPLLAKKAKVEVIEINPQDTPISRHADVVYRENATKGLELWWQARAS